MVRIIQHLQITHGISFFITPLDFNTLSDWWEKRIPISVLKESIDNVVERRKKRGKPVQSFSSFYHEVKKNFTSFLQLSVGVSDDSKLPNQPRPGDSPGSGDAVEAVEYDEFAELTHFLENFPTPLAPLKEEFQKVFQQVMSKGNTGEEGVEKVGDVDEAEAGIEGLNRKLVELFAGNEELEVKVKLFTQNLAPPLRKPEIENRYRLNFLLKRFNVPDLELF